MKALELLPFAELLRKYPNASIEQCEPGPPNPHASLSSKSVRKEHMTRIGVGAYRARKLPAGA